MSYDILNHVVEHKIILFRPFFAATDNHVNRDFHSHNCVEMSYVLSGTADHFITLPDGTQSQQKLCAGNYMILDPNARHAYKNGSRDFEVMNLLMKMSMLEQSVTENRSLSSTKAFSVTRSEWNVLDEANDIELKFFIKEPRALGKSRYVLLWLDLKGDRNPIDFRRARVGLVADHDLARPYLPAPRDEGSRFYYFGENESQWVPMEYGTDGCFGTQSVGSVKGLRGWFAFPIEDLQREEDGQPLNAESMITGFYFYYAMDDAAMVGNNLYIDTISFVEDFRSINLGQSNLPSVIDFGKATIKVSVTGRNGRMDPELHVEQIKIAFAENQDFYTLIQKLYPRYKYSKIKSTPVNRVYFDKDGSVKSLFQICYESSRMNMHEWHKMVHHALSLIILVSLQSFDKYIRAKKDTIIDVVKKHVDAHFMENITLTEICARHFYSVPYVSHKFKEVLNCSFEQYLRQLRIKHACELLLRTVLSVGEIAEQCGYTSVRSFRKAFHCVVGQSPVEFRCQYNQ